MAQLLFDRQTALARVGDDEELLRELVQLFLVDYPSSLEAIRKAVAEGDAHRLERAAHNLKGSVANFGAEEVVREALDLEMQGRAGDLAHANLNLQRLCGALQKLDGELRCIAS